MQVSELFRRGIVCPLDDAAEDQLRLLDVERTTRVRVVQIPDEPTFIALWQLGLFSQINSRCGTIVDDYEEELVEASSLAGVVAAIDYVSASTSDSTLAVLLAELRSLAREAEATSRPLLFVL